MLKNEKQKNNYELELNFSKGINENHPFVENKQNWAHLPLEQEESILGVLLKENALFLEIQTIISENDFFHANLGLYYAALLKIYQKDFAVDKYKLQQELVNTNFFDGKEEYLKLYIEKLYNRGENSNFTDYKGFIELCNLLKRCSIKRQQMAILQRGNTLLINSPYTDTDKITLQIQTSLDSLNTQTLDSQQQDLSHVEYFVFQSLKELDEARNQDFNALTGVSSQFIDLDKYTNGFKEDELIVIAGRPAMGKTAFALNIAQNIALNDVDAVVAIFSLEMGKKQLLYRFFSSIADVEMSKLKSANFNNEEWEKILTAGASLNVSSIWLDDSANLTINTMRAKLNRLNKQIQLANIKEQMQKKIKLVVVDYLQLMSSGKFTENRVNEVSEITRSLKKIAKEFKVPIIALSQLSRRVEERADKRPMLADLRESGSIEQDADLVLMLYRENYYKKISLKEQKNNNASSSVENEDENENEKAELIIAKHRNGRTGIVNLLFKAKTTTFENYIEQNYIPDSVNDILTKAEDNQKDYLSVDNIKNETTNNNMNNGNDVVEFEFF